MEQVEPTNKFTGEIHRVKLLELMNDWHEQVKPDKKATGELYRTKLIELMDEWDEQVKEFRRLSLATDHPVEVTRMRAKADTLDYNRREVLLFVEEMDLLDEDTEN